MRRATTATAIINRRVVIRDSRMVQPPGKSKGVTRQRYRRTQAKFVVFSPLLSEPLKRRGVLHLVFGRANTEFRTRAALAVRPAFR
jgi:hypothetical protein